MSQDKEDKALVEAYQGGKTAYSLQEKLMIDKCFMQMKADLLLRFEQTGYKDDDDRREVWRKLQTIAWLQESLTDLSNNGKMAEKELEKKGFFNKFKRNKG